MDIEDIKYMGMGFVCVSGFVAACFSHVSLTLFFSLLLLGLVLEK